MPPIEAQVTGTCTQDPAEPGMAAGQGLDPPAQLSGTEWSPRPHRGRSPVCVHVPHHATRKGTVITEAPPASSQFSRVTAPPPPTGLQMPALNPQARRSVRAHLGARDWEQVLGERVLGGRGRVQGCPGSLLFPHLLRDSGAPTPWEQRPPALHPHHGRPSFPLG